MSTTDFPAWAQSVAERVEQALSRFLPPATTRPTRLHEAMRYAALGGGKRVRPMLAFGAGNITGADPARLEVVAASVELIHAYSLVHDDLPCMDDDTLRRGRPTCHVAFDEATALLVGDALQSLAFELLAEHRLADDPTTQLAMVRTLAAASGSRGMAGGQAIDLAAVGQALALPELERMHLHKTGALIRASVALGARCGNNADAPTLERLDRYAQCVGLAFQVVDDILDESGTAASLGKTAGKDREAGKPTYTSLLGLGEARTLAGRLLADAHAALAVFDERAAPLRALADFIVRRDR